jgi:hypothetical protein
LPINYLSHKEVKEQILMIKMQTRRAGAFNCPLPSPVLPQGLAAQGKNLNYYIGIYKKS